MSPCLFYIASTVFFNSTFQDNCLRQMGRNTRMIREMSSTTNLIVIGLYGQSIFSHNNLPKMYCNFVEWMGKVLVLGSPL